jgi:hypothetical protein
MANTAKSLILISSLDGERGVLQLQLSTRKSENGKLYSSGHVQWAKDRCVTFELCGDYSKTFYTTPTRVTATQKAIDKQHAAVFTPERVEEIKAEVVAFYAAKDAKNAEHKARFHEEFVA